MATYVEAPNIPDWDSLDEHRSVYLAGGIGTDWRKEIVGRLADTDLVLLSPFNISMIYEQRCGFDQVVWEHLRMRESAAILFWFQMESLCPISLYELGYWLALEGSPECHTIVFIGIHPEYEKRLDVEQRVNLLRGDGGGLIHTEIVYSLNGLKQQVLQWASEKELA